jgi:hypothetical protein
MILVMAALAERVLAVTDPAETILADIERARSAAKPSVVAAIAVRTLMRLGPSTSLGVDSTFEISGLFEPSAPWINL